MLWSRTAVGLAARDLIFAAWRAGAQNSRWRPRQCSLILAYHEVPSAAGFGRQLDVVEALRLRVVSPAEAARAVRHRIVLPGTVAFTFDDCTSNQIENAATVLRRRGLPAAFYPPLNYLGGRSTWWKQSEAEAALPVAGPDQLRSLASDGFEIGSHGLSHRSFSTLLVEEQQRELRHSKATLEALTGTVTFGFCFPYGDVPPGAASRAQRAGYEYALGVERRPLHASDDPYRLPRLTVLGDPTQNEFRAYLDGSILPFWSVRRRVLGQMRAIVRRLSGRRDPRRWEQRVP